jgi:S-formylglutathione hydrolase FrmB
MNVLVPQKVRTQIGLGSSASAKGYPVLYLLHGFSDDHSIWMRWTSVERYAAERNVIIVMADGGKSFYTDMFYGDKYFTFFAEELPEIAAGFFPVLPGRENTFVAGLSMGGYGALKLALRYPERYAGCAALSAVTDMQRFLEEYLSDPPEVAEAYFGPEKKVPADCDIFALADRCGNLPTEKRPRILQYCGTEDFLWEQNVRLRDHIRTAGGFDYSWEEAPGCHSWDFWDHYIKKVIAEFF